MEHNEIAIRPKYMGRHVLDAPLGSVGGTVEDAIASSGILFHPNHAIGSDSIGSDVVDLPLLFTVRRVVQQAPVVHHDDVVIGRDGEVADGRNPPLWSVGGTV